MKMVRKEEKKGDVERCPTGIAGFDNLCEGGLVADSANLVVGNAGAGKTTFLLQFSSFEILKCTTAKSHHIYS